MLVGAIFVHRDPIDRPTRCWYMGTKARMERKTTHAESKNCITHTA